MKTILLFLLAIVSLIQIGCKCSRTSDIIGPDACPSAQFVSSNLVIKDNNDITNSGYLDLANSYANISATFNEVISYTLTIKGTPSGAVFVSNGKGNALSLNWYGNSNNGKYFKKGDVLSVQLTNVCKTESIGTDGITITSTIGYNGLGYKVINYDESPSIFSGVYGDAGSPVYGSSKLMIPGFNGYVASPQGGNYFKFKTDSVSSTAHQDANGKNINWFLGGTTFFANTTAQTAALGEDPSKVYLNFFARGQVNSQVQMSISETAHGSSLNRLFVANVGPEWTLYSVRLSDIGILKPSSIHTLSLGLGAATHMDSSGEVDLDLVIFTLDKPF